MEELWNETAEINKKKVLNYIHETTFSIICSLSRKEMPKIFIKSKPNNYIESNTSQAKHFKIDLTNLKSTKKLTLYVKLLSLIQNLVESNRYSTKRNIYYQYKHLFQSQTNLDKFIQDLARTINVPRSSLNIVSTSKGLIAGDLEILMNDGSVLSPKTIKNGVLVPTLIENIRALRSDAQFTLIVEKDATFQHLIDNNFTQKYSAILITGKGEPDINTRELLNLLYKNFQMKFFCLTDANPFGVCIMSVYKYGSKSYVHENDNLCLPSLEWIGLKLDDLEFFYLKNKSELLMELTQQDIKIAKGLIKKLKKVNECELVKQLEFMIHKNCKTELQYLDCISNSFLCDTYLRAKLDSLISISNLYENY